MRLGLRIALGGLALLAAAALSGFAPEHHKLTLAVQATGTVKWELAAMHELGIDEKHLLDLTVNDVADAPAGQVALQAKGTDIILSDFVWVSLQRHQGSMVTMVPHSMLADPGVSETPPLVGWTFFEDNARKKKKEFKAFFDASFETKAALLTDDAVWEKIRPVMNVGDDDSLFKQLRDDYRAGIVQKYSADDMAPAEAAFAVMAKFGGPDVVGDATELAPGTFYKGYRK